MKFKMEIDISYHLRLISEIIIFNLEMFKEFSLFNFELME